MWKGFRCGWGIINHRRCPAWQPRDTAELTRCCVIKWNHRDLWHTRHRISFSFSRFPPELRRLYLRVLCPLPLVRFSGIRLPLPNKGGDYSERWQRLVCLWRPARSRPESAQRRWWMRSRDFVPEPTLDNQTALRCRSFMQGTLPKKKKNNNPPLQRELLHVTTSEASWVLFFWRQLQPLLFIFMRWKQNSVASNFTQIKRILTFVSGIRISFTFGLHCLDLVCFFIAFWFSCVKLIFVTDRVWI